MTQPTSVRKLWTSFALTVIISVIAFVVIIMAAGSFYGNSVAPFIILPLLFTIILIPPQTLLFTIVATIRLKRRLVAGRSPGQRAFLATLILALLNLVGSEVLTLMAGGWKGAESGFGLLIVMPFCFGASFLLMPFAYFFSGGRWLPYGDNNSQHTR